MESTEVALEVVHLRKLAELFVLTPLTIKFVLDILLLREEIFQALEDAIVRQRAERTAKKIPRVVDLLVTEEIITLKKCVEKLQIVHGPTILVSADFMEVKAVKEHRNMQSIAE